MEVKVEYERVKAEKAAAEAKLAEETEAGLRAVCGAVEAIKAAAADNAVPLTKQATSAAAWPHVKGLLPGRIAVVLRDQITGAVEIAKAYLPKFEALKKPLAALIDKATKDNIATIQKAEKCSYARAMELFSQVGWNGPGHKSAEHQELVAIQAELDRATAPSAPAIIPLNIRFDQCIELAGSLHLPNGRKLLEGLRVMIEGEPPPMQSNLISGPVG